LPVESNLPPQLSSKGKAPAISVDIAVNKAPNRPGSGMLTGARSKGIPIDFLAVVGFLSPFPTHDCILLERERA